MKKTSSEVNFKLGIFETLFLIFLVLKLVPGTDAYNWSWWAITSPLWAPLLFFMAVALIVLVIWGIIKISKWVMYGK